MTLVAALGAAAARGGRRRSGATRRRVTVIRLTRRPVLLAQRQRHPRDGPAEGGEPHPEALSGRLAGPRGAAAEHEADLGPGARQRARDRRRRGVERSVAAFTPSEDGSNAARTSHRSPGGERAARRRSPDGGRPGARTGPRRARRSPPRRGRRARCRRCVRRTAAPGSGPRRGCARRRRARPA